MCSSFNVSLKKALLIAYFLSSYFLQELDKDRITAEYSETI